MKTKNVALAAIAFVIAIGSAFASFLAPENIYVRAKLRSDPDGLTACVNTGIQCDNAGGTTCTVTVPVITGSNTATTGGTFIPYKGTTCLDELKGSSAFPGGNSSVNTIHHLVVQ